MSETNVDDAALREASHNLGHPLAEVRDAAERMLLRARERAVPYLVEALDAPTPPGGTPPPGRVALLLGAMRARPALPALLARVTAPEVSVDVVPLIARAIAEIVDGRDAFDDDVREALERLAGSHDRFVRAFAAQAFGSLGDLRSRARVEALTSDPDPWVQERAEIILQRLNAATLADDNPTLDDFAALAAAAQAQGGDLAPWLADLGDPRRAVRDAAVEQLVGAGRAAVPYLLEKLNQPHVTPRIAAALALGRIQTPDAIGPLIIAATGSADTEAELELVAVALRAVANCLTGTEEGLASTLIPLARHADRFVRAAALLCLGRMPDGKAVRAVVEALSDPDAFVVESAAIALSEGVREEDAALVWPLLSALEQAPHATSPALREAILIALSRVAIEDPGLRVRVRHRVRREVTGSTVSMRKAAIALLERLHDEHDPPVLPLLDDVMGRLRDDHPEVRVVAASFLAQHLAAGFTHAVQRLCDAIDRDEKTLTLLCMEALRRVDTPAARAALEALCASGDVDIRARADELLEGFSPQHAEWQFVAKSRGAVHAPPRAESQRPKASARPGRVRAVSQTSDDTVVPPTGGPSGAVVEARFDDATNETPPPK